MDPAIAQLLDDPNPAVRKALLAHFNANGASAAAFLRQQAEQKGPVGKAAVRYLRELNFSDPVEDFRLFIRSLNYELETGFVLLARTVSPQADAGICHAALDAIASRCRELLVEPSNPREKCRTINRVLFHEWGFRGDPEHFSDPRNSLIDQVLARRKGLPISLGTIYLLVAGRLGMDLYPVGLPGLFLVGGESDGAPFFADPFERGALHTELEVLELLRRREYTPQPGELGPTPVREVLCRSCRTLVNHYREAGESDKARLFASFIEEFEAAYVRNER
ncbi:MAG TPA: transglutaminase-like domain-containing protein [Opitutaceae bacterium]